MRRNGSSNLNNVGAHVGLTPRAFNSGGIDDNGHVSTCGDAIARVALYEEANLLTMRTKHWSAPRAWAIRVEKKASLKRGHVVLARQRAVVVHRMWTDGIESCPPYDFGRRVRWTDKAPAAP